MSVLAPPAHTFSRDNATLNQLSLHKQTSTGRNTVLDEGLCQCHACIGHHSALRQGMLLLLSLPASPCQQPVSGYYFETSHQQAQAIKDNGQDKQLVMSMECKCMFTLCIIIYHVAITTITATYLHHFCQQSKMLEVCFFLFCRALERVLSMRQPASSRQRQVEKRKGEGQTPTTTMTCPPWLPCLWAMHPPCCLLYLMAAARQFPGQSLFPI